MLILEAIDNWQNGKAQSTDEKAQRKHQKAKRKLSFTRKAPTYADNFPPSTGFFMDSP